MANMWILQVIGVERQGNLAVVKLAENQVACSITMTWEEARTVRLMDCWSLSRPPVPEEKTVLAIADGRDWLQQLARERRRKRHSRSAERGMQRNAFLLLRREAGDYSPG